jgi:hypothetical protein
MEMPKVDTLKLHQYKMFDLKQTETLMKPIPPECGKLLFIVSRSKSLFGKIGSGYTLQLDDNEVQ